MTIRELIRAWEDELVSALAREDVQRQQVCRAVLGALAQVKVAA